MEDDVRTQSVLDMARAIWARRKWLAVLAFVGPLAAVISVLAFMPRLYEAKAIVLVERLTAMRTNSRLAHHAN